MWGDFITHDRTTPLIYQRGRGLAFGLPVTAHLVESTPIVGFLRAHQHNNARDSGPMLDAVADAGGAFDNWGGGGGGGGGGSGHVVTFLSGAHIPHLGFGRDAYGLLRLPGGDPAGWTLALCGQDVGAQYLVGIDDGGGGGGGSGGGGGAPPTSPADEGGAGGWKLAALGPGWRARLRVAHACNAAVAFHCRDLPWAPAGRGRGRHPPADAPPAAAAAA